MICVKNCNRKFVWKKGLVIVLFITGNVRAELRDMRWALKICSPDPKNMLAGP